MTNIFISGFPPKTDEIELVKLFVPFAQVNTIQIGRDKRTGKPKGYAFMELHHHAEALEAVANLDGSTYNDSVLSVKIAEDKATRLAQKSPPPATGTGRYTKVERFSPAERSKRPRLGK